MIALSKHFFMPPFGRRAYPKTRELGSRAINPYELEIVDLVNKFLDFLVQELESDNKKSSFINTLRKAIQNNSSSAKRINFNVEESVFKSFLLGFLEQKNVPNKAAEMTMAMNSLISGLCNKGYIAVIEYENKPDSDNYQTTYKLIRELRKLLDSNEKQCK